MPVRRLEIILLSLICLTPGLVFAEPARDVLIKKQLDCVDRQLAAGSDQLQWVDICYSDEMQKLHASGEGDTLKQLTEDMARDKKMAEIQRWADRPQPAADDKDTDIADPQLRELIEQDQPREFLAEDVASIVAEVAQDRAGLIYKEPGVLIRSHLDLSVGYRQDDLNWNIAGDTSGNNPNILSELTWSDLDIPIVKLSGNAVLWEHLVIDGMYDHGKIIDGDNQDSDYLGDNRTSEFSRSNNGVDQDDVWDVSAAMGYRMYYGADWGNFGVDDLWITALGGYSYHEQNLFIIDGTRPSRYHRPGRLAACAVNTIPNGKDPGPGWNSPGRVRAFLDFFGSNTTGRIITPRPIGTCALISSTPKVLST